MKGADGTIPAQRYEHNITVSRHVLFDDREQLPVG
jgi:hypothetical protein